MLAKQQIYIGTSGYSYPGPPPKGWFGVFYPEVPAKRIDQLEYYSQLFNIVEINSSFYGPPSEKITEAWVRKTPGDFVFAVKLWQKFTHPTKVGHRGSAGEWEPISQDDMELFRAGLQPLADARKLGALLLQYPTGFHYSPANVEKLQNTLSYFPQFPKAVELRHKSWSERGEETTALLEQHRSTWVLIDEPKFASSVRQKFEPMGGMLYFRAHGRNAQKWWNHKESWERYDYCYSRAEIKEMAEQIKSATEKRGTQKAFLFFNNHARANAAANAIMLSQELEISLKAMPSEALVAKFPQLASFRKGD
ncbi:MAG: DUF72 domain-containing protein [Candidatus Binatia bacterium]